MQQEVESTEISLDAYTMCSFVPEAGLRACRPAGADRVSARRGALLRLAGPKEGIEPGELTDDPYYAKVLREPRAYFKKKLAKYVEETGCVKRGIEMLIDCHQNHLAFTPLAEMREQPIRRPLEVELIGAY